MDSMEEKLKKVTDELNERKKELNYLHRSSDIINSASRDFEEILKGVTDCIPDAMQYPEITCAELILRGQKFRTDEFRETEWNISNDIIVNGKNVGKIIIYYMEERPGFERDPFSEEKKILLKNLTERIGTLIEGIWTAEAIAVKTQEIIELSAPITQVWDDILILPLIGTLDSERTLQMMENLLLKIKSTGASFVIMDATGVGTIDSAVAANIVKTSLAINMLGSQMIFTGIKPGIAMTMVHLGIDLEDIVTKATLQEGFEYALYEKNIELVRKNE
ncbi:MAG: STAS domain-containing protein [Euryarchaeota archaeon]|nr:STAS domain-containing protein [Euryarchaeota archaeon]